MISLKKNHQMIKEIRYLMLNEYDTNHYSSNECNSNEMSYNNNSDDSYDNLSLYDISEKEMENIEKRIYKKQKQSVIISVEEAIRIIQITVCDTNNYIRETIIKTNDAYDRITARDVYSPVNVPPYKTSAKHGYAVLASDGKGVRKVLKAQATFDKISVVPGTCMRVRSGDAIPNGANTVVTPENIKILDECNDNDDNCFNIDKEYEIEVLVAPEINENIRNAGDEIKCFQFIVPKFTCLGPAELGILTLCSLDLISVTELPSVGLLSISSELEEPKNTLTLGRIYESNRVTLTSLLKKNGYVPVDFGISAYKLNAIIKKIENALDEVDVLVIMGHSNDKDILKSILREYFNAMIHFGLLNMKPGKSTMFASCTYNFKKKIFLCMSANPATVPIVAQIVLLPLLNTMHGNFFKRPIILQTCVNNHELHLRPKFLWTTVQWAEQEMFPRAYCSKNRHQDIIKYQKANALLMLPPRTWQVPNQETFDFFLLRQFSSDDQQLNEQSNQPIEQFSAELNQASVIDSYIVNNLAGNVSLIQFVKCDKKRIKEELVYMSTQYNGSVILLVGDTLSDVVHDAIKEVIDNNVLIDVNIFISNLTENLECFIKRPICGIRNSSLIINMCGSYVNVEESLKAFGDVILDILCLISKSNKQIFDIKKDDSCVEPSNNNNNDKPGNNSTDDNCSAEEFENNNNDGYSDDLFYNDSNNDNSAGPSKNNINDDIHNSNKTSMDLSFEEQSKPVLIMKDFYKKQKGSEMVSLEEAKDIMKKVIDKHYERRIETVQTNDAYGRIVAKDIYSSVNVPPCCISAKHGYAVLASDGEGVRKVLKSNLTLIKKILIVPGTCMRVRSGDPIPDGATAVVKSANTKVIDEYDNDDYFNIDSKEYEIEVLVAPKEGENIRNAGCEIGSNEIVKRSHSRVKTADLGILTLCDIDSITVLKLPSVGLLFIDYDLLKFEKVSKLGRIYDCNKIIVFSLLKKNGYDPMDFGVSAYEPNIMKYRIMDALDKVDLLVIIGRANDKDILKPTLKIFFDADIHFGGVNIKPGKSTTFATCEFNKKRKFFLCMSANPATVPIITHVLLLPLLNILSYNSDDNPLKIQTRIKTSHDLHLRPKLSWTSLQWSEKEVEMYPTAHCTSTDQHMMKYQFSNALLMLPSYTSEVPKLNANSAFLSAMFTGN
ncbi:PREDICTED: gephyrin-like [Trachymyrmex cornetzi]|uniref:gephyrin-like n=1 Tax=Trachymyrmex cornetzi TaxID=471704 RepID=UPI00084ED61F|nr:PREDICTED: gephyrin-like [Trachymyrmex cornetzi]